MVLQDRGERNRREHADRHKPQRRRTLRSRLGQRILTLRGQRDRVSRRFDRAAETSRVDPGGVDRDRGASGVEVDRRGTNTGDRLDRGLNALDAASAGHTGDRKFDHGV
jgi:hypothetical protein